MVTNTTATYTVARGSEEVTMTNLFAYENTSLNNGVLV